MGYTLAQIEGYLAAADRIRRGRVIEAALAVRAGFSDEKGFESFRKAMDGAAP